MLAVVINGPPVCGAVMYPTTGIESLNVRLGVSVFASNVPPSVNEPSDCSVNEVIVNVPVRSPESSNSTLFPTSVVGLGNATERSGDGASVAVGAGPQPEYGVNVVGTSRASRVNKLS